MQVWNRSPDRRGSLAGARGLCTAWLSLLLFAPPTLAATPVITSFNLTHSFTCGGRHFLMEADGLELGLTVKVTQTGQPDIVATSIGGIEGFNGPLGWVSGVFDLSPGVAGGLWSVTVTNPGGESDTLADALEVVPDCPRGAVGDFYVCNQRTNSVLQFDGVTGQFVCVFAEYPPGMGPVGFGPPTFQPADLAWAGNGHLWVTSGGSNDDPKAVVEYDGSTGAFIRYIVPPTTVDEGLRNPISLSFGGPNGALHLVIQETAGNPDAAVSRLDDEPPALPVVVLEPEIAPVPVMVNPPRGRFASNGNFLLLGTSIQVPRPTFREFDGQTLAFVRDMAIDLGDKTGVLETLDGCCYLVAESKGETRVDSYDIATGQLAGTFIPPSPGLGDAQHPLFFEAMDLAMDIAFGPNGHFYVSAFDTPVPGIPPALDWGIDYLGMGAVHEFDGVTGEQVGMIGRNTFYNGSVTDPTKLWEPNGIEFKPMPGDYASAGGAFQGDWQVGLDDLAKFTGVSPFTGEPVFGGPNVSCNDPHALLSFDQDRDGDLDLADFAAFQRVFGSSMAN